jgi:hypothetical protein
MCHTMPAGAPAVSVHKVTGKRQAGGFEFFYHGWKQENPTGDNCRFGASRDLLFPPDRQVQLDVNYLKKMGLTRKRMLECDALFFYQLLLPVVDPAMSGINEDPRMGYYEEVAQNTNMYAFGKKNRGGTRGHLFCPIVGVYIVWSVRFKDRPYLTWILKLKSILVGSWLQDNFPPYFHFIVLRATRSNNIY